jgi:hypothetical protein
MAQATLSAPTTENKKTTPTHIIYCLIFPKSTGENYRNGVVFVPDIENKRAIPIRRMVHRLTWRQYEIVKEHPIVSQYLQKGWMKIVAEGTNIIRDVVASGEYSKSQTIETTVRNCADRELLEAALAYGQDMDLSNPGSEGFQIIKMVKKRLEAMDGDGIALESYSNTPPTDEPGDEEFTFFA